MADIALHHGRQPRRCRRTKAAQQVVRVQLQFRIFHARRLTGGLLRKVSDLRSTYFFQVRCLIIRALPPQIEPIRLVSLHNDQRLSNHSFHGYPQGRPGLSARPGQPLESPPNSWLHAGHRGGWHGRPQRRAQGIRSGHADGQTAFRPLRARKRRCTFNAPTDC